MQEVTYEQDIITASNLLGSIKILKEREEQISAKKSTFNIFSILGLDSSEVRLHSAILTDLLNPRGTHGHGAIFLQKFIEQLEQGIDLKLFSEAKVTAELANQFGRVDIFIKGDSSCIIVENKIYAGDQPKQLERYYQYAQSLNIQPKNIHLIYLTLYGVDPSEDSLGKIEIEKVVSLSYHTDVTQWLDLCVKEVSREPEIRETIFQYQQLLKKLTGQLIDKTYLMKIKELLYENQNFKVINDLAKAVVEFKIDVASSFWDDLGAELEKRYKLIEDKSSVSRSKIEKYFTGTGNILKRYWFGYSFQVMPWKDSYEICFRVEIENNIYMGFFVLKGQEYYKGCDNPEFAEVVSIIKNLKSIGRDSGSNSGWLGYWYPKCGDFDFENFNTDTIYQLVKPETRKKLIDNFVAEIDEAIAEFKKSIRELKPTKR